MAREAVRVRTKPQRLKGAPVAGTGVWVDVSGCTVAPRMSSETNDRGSVVISGFVVKLPALTVIEDDYELEIRGEVHQIEGAVGDFGRRGKLVYTVKV